MDELILKMLMDYAKFRKLYWADGEYKIQNVELKGDTIFYHVRDDHYTKHYQIDLLELLAWVYSNVTI